MADELTPQEQRELDAIDRALTGRAVDPELEDIAALTNDLHEARATPSPEFAAELDRRAAAWLGEAPVRTRRFGWLRLAIPAATAAVAAVVVAVAVTGGGEDGDPRLELSAVEHQTRGALAAPEGGAQEDSAATGDASTFAINADELRVSYTVFRTTQARVKLGDHEQTIELEPGSGTIEISPEGYEAGEYILQVRVGDFEQRANVQLD